jgi:hypothetical protein
MCSASGLVRRRLPHNFRTAPAEKRNTFSGSSWLKQISYCLLDAKSKGAFGIWCPPTEYEQGLKQNMLSRTDEDGLVTAVWHFSASGAL